VSHGGAAGEEVAQVDKVGLSVTAENSQPQVVGLLPWGCKTNCGHFSKCAGQCSIEDVVWEIKEHP